MSREGVRRIGFLTSWLLLVAGVAVTVLYPSRFTPCSVLTEFSCGTDHRVVLRAEILLLTIFVSSVVFAVTHRFTRWDR